MYGEQMQQCGGIQRAHVAASAKRKNTALLECPLLVCMKKKTAAYLPVRERVQRGNNPINTLECGRKDGDGTFGRYLGPGDCLHALAEQNSKYTYAGSHQLLHPPRSSGSIRRRS